MKMSASLKSVSGIVIRSRLAAYIRPLRGEGDLAMTLTLKFAASIIVAIALGALGFLAWTLVTNRDHAGENEPLPFKVVGPDALASALKTTPFQDQKNADAYFFILDLPTNRLYRIQQRNCQPECPRRVRWLDNSSLEVETTSASVYRATLSGSVQRTGPTTAAPGTSIPPAFRPPVESPDRRWLTMEKVIPEGNPTQIVIADSAGQPKFLLSSTASNGNTNIGAPAWGPTADILAFIGNYCVGAGQPDFKSDFDLFLFDPDRQKLTNLTANLVATVYSFAWRPDGKALAVDLGFSGAAGYSSLSLIDAVSGHVQPLIDLQVPGLYPMGWSPDGTKLLFYLFGGGGACENSPPTPPTSVQTIGP